MVSPYQEFVQKARERFQERQARKPASGPFLFTRHARFKMKQYSLSEQKIRGVIRNPKRREEGIAKDTIAVMQPVSPKRDTSGKESWKQEIWVMFQTKKQGVGNREQKKETESPHSMFSTSCSMRIISAWRYPGVSPKRNPIPTEILREIEEGSILEVE